MKKPSFDGGKRTADPREESDQREYHMRVRAFRKPLARAVSLVLGCMLMLGLLPTAAFAQEGTTATGSGSPNGTASVAPSSFDASALAGKENTVGSGDMLPLAAGGILPSGFDLPALSGHEDTTNSANSGIMPLDSLLTPEDSGDYGLIFDVASGEFWLDVDGNQALDASDTPYTAQTWGWDGTMLSLDSFSWTTPASCALTIVGGDVTIALTGSSTFESTCTAATDDSYGIYAPGTITVTGDGTLNAIGGSSAAGSVSYGIESANLTMDSGAVNAMGGASAGGSYGIYTGTIVANGGTLNAQGASAASGYSLGIDALNLTVDGTLVKATAGTASEGSFGIWIRTYGSAQFDSGTLEAAGNSAALSLSTYPALLLTLPPAYTYWTNVTPVDPGGAGTAFPGGAAYNYTGSEKYLKFTTLPVNNGNNQGGGDPGSLIPNTGDTASSMAWILLPAVLLLALASILSWRKSHQQ